MPSGFTAVCFKEMNDKDCGSLGLTHEEVQVLLLVVDVFDFTVAILNEEKIKLK